MDIHKTVQELADLSVNVLSDGGGPVGRSTMRQVDRQVYITELRASKVRCSEPITQHATSFPSKSDMPCVLPVLLDQVSLRATS